MILYTFICNIISNLMDIHPILNKSMIANNWSLFAKTCSIINLEQTNED